MTVIDRGLEGESVMRMQGLLGEFHLLGKLFAPRDVPQIVSRSSSTLQEC